MYRDYELVFILKPEVSEDEVRSILDRIENIARESGGQILDINQVGRRRLAYPIQRHRDGYYIYIDMILAPASVAEIERLLKVSETVIRYMTKLRDAKTIQREREERAERKARAAAAEAESAAAAAAAATAAPVESSEAEATTEAPAAEAVEVEETAAPTAQEGESTPVAEENNSETVQA